MTLLAFEPETDIEHQIIRAQNGDLSGDALLRQIAGVNIYIPSTTEVQTDGSGFGPVLLEQDGQPFVATFTALSRPPKDMAAYLMQMNGRQFFLRMPPGYGVMINPGYATQLLVPPQGMAAFKADLAKPVAASPDPR